MNDNTSNLMIILSVGGTRTGIAIPFTEAILNALVDSIPLEIDTTWDNRFTYKFDEAVAKHISIVAKNKIDFSIYKKVDSTGSNEKI